MRKLMALGGLTALLSIFPVSPAFAEGAVIDKDSGVCQGQVPNSSGQLAGQVLDGTLFVRENKSWLTMTCHFDVPPELAPSKATHARGFICHIPPLSTTDTRASASSGGRMVMTCRVKK